MKAVLIPTVEEQLAAGNDEIIDPAGVSFPEGWSGPVFFENDYRVPEGIVGNARNLRVEEGRLVADVQILDDGRFKSFSIAGMNRGSGVDLLAVAAHGGDVWDGR